MNRLVIAILNLILIIVGFFIIYSGPWSALAITLGMLLIAVSIISFAFLIYFPPAMPRYVKLRVVEEMPKPTRHIVRKTRKKPKKASRKKKR